MEPTTRQPLFAKPWALAFWAALIAVVVLVYWPSFSVPFYLDDYTSIVENPDLHDAADWQPIWDHTPQRFVGSLSLAANYTLHGTSVTGYHIVNLAIHLGAGVALWLLLAALVRSPAVDADASRWLIWVPFVATAFYLLHPLQTQAITYIVQRYASLAAFFYLAAMASYAWWRLRGSAWLLALMAVCVVLAVLTKQNAVTVFLALPLIELLFFRRLAVAARLALAGATLALALGGYWLVNQPDLDSLTRETHSISRLDYLATQVGLLWWYAGHFFYPTGQRLEFDFPLVTSFMSPAVLGAIAAHLAALTVAFLAWRRAPLLAFGILFWYLAHAVESSILPITDLAFEHRTYLPNAGLVTAIAVGIAWVAARNRLAIAGLAILAVAALGALSWLTWERNRLWQDPVAFLQHDVEQSPQSERAWTSLGKELLRRERFEEALQAFGNALNLARTEEGLEVQPATLVNTVIALHHTGQHRKGFEFAKIIPLGTLRDIDRSRLHEVRGLTLAKLRQMGPARYELTEALKFHDNLNAAAWLAYVELIDGEAEEAAERALAVLARKPDHALALQVLERADPDAVPELLRSVVPP